MTEHVLLMSTPVEVSTRCAKCRETLNKLVTERKASLVLNDSFQNEVLETISKGKDIATGEIIALAKSI